MLLKNEIEKIKLIISLYLNDDQDENILFNPQEQSALSEKKKKKYKNIKNLILFNKSIKKLINLNNQYNDLIRTNYNEENNCTKIKQTKNENTQYNPKDFITNVDNPGYINNLLNENEEKTKNNMNDKEENKLKENSNKKDIFQRFKTFNRNKKSELTEKKLKSLNEDNNKEEKINLTETETEFIERRTIHTNKKEEESENENKENNDKNYKIIEEKEKIISMSNKDILSIFDRTKYNNDIDNEINDLNNKKGKITNDNKEEINKENEDNNNNENNNNSESNEEFNDNYEKTSENEEDEFLEDEDKTKEDFIMKELTKYDDNNKIETELKNDINLFSLDKEIKNNIDSLNIIPNENEKKEQPKKKIKSKKSKKNINKNSQEKAK